MSILNIFSRGKKSAPAPAPNPASSVPIPEGYRLLGAGDIRPAGYKYRVSGMWVPGNPRAVGRIIHPLDGSERAYIAPVRRKPTLKPEGADLKPFTDQWAWKYVPDNDPWVANMAEPIRQEREKRAEIQRRIQAQMSADPVQPYKYAQMQAAASQGYPFPHHNYLPQYNPPAGFRIMCDGETLREDDIVFCFNKWHPVTVWKGIVLGKGAYRAMYYARKIAAPVADAKVLSDPSDAELDKAFGNEFGWAPTKGDADAIAVYRNVFGYDLPVDFFRPKYCSQFELVLPFLEAWSSTSRQEIRTFASVGLWTIILDGDMFNEVRWTDKSLARAAVLALLASKGWKISFTNSTK